MNIARLRVLKRMIDHRAEAFRGVNMDAFAHLNHASRHIENAITAEKNRMSEKETVTASLTVVDEDPMNSLQKDLAKILFNENSNKTW